MIKIVHGMHNRLPNCFPKSQRLELQDVDSELLDLCGVKKEVEALGSPKHGQSIHYVSWKEVVSSCLLSIYSCADTSPAMPGPCWNNLFYCSEIVARSVTRRSSCDLWI